MEGARRPRRRATRGPRPLVRVVRACASRASSARTDSTARRIEPADMSDRTAGAVELDDDVRAAPVPHRPTRDAVARAVRESLEHLRPWMPWADDESARRDVPAPAAPRRRSRRRRRGEEWQYGLFPTDESSRARVVRADDAAGPGHDRDRLLGARGRDRPRARDAGERRAHQRVARARRHRRPCTSAATSATCAAPRSLAASATRSTSRRARAPEAPGESGRLMIWSRREPVAMPARMPPSAAPSSSPPGRVARNRSIDSGIAPSRFLHSGAQRSPRNGHGRQAGATTRVRTVALASRDERAAGRRRAGAGGALGSGFRRRCGARPRHALGHAPSGGRPRRFVSGERQRLFDARHHVGPSSRVDHVERDEVLVHLRDPARAGDHGRDVRVLRAPRERRAARACSRDRRRSPSARAPCSLVFGR